MKILLVSPESKVWNSRAHLHNGLGYLAGSLLANGYTEVTLHDGAVEYESVADVLDRAIAESKPYDVVGISAPTVLIDNGWAAARQAKARGAITIMGGPHLTLQPDESMHKPEVDLVVRGEGEDALIEILRILEEGKSVSDVRFRSVLGLSWRDVAGNVLHNLDRPLRPDIDNIPLPAYHLFKIERYTNLNPLTDGLDPHARAYTVVTSRGCPYKCTYCSKPITGDTWRARSVENVLKEWRILVRDFHATEIGLTDDIWNLDLKRAKALCRALIDEKLNTVPWVTIHGMKVNHTDLELFQLMKAAGCKRVGFGVENGDEQILKTVIRKAQTLDMVRKAFKNAKTAGLQTMGFFIFGMPHETEETMEKTIRLALELDPDLAHFMIAAPYPGTELWKLVQKEGILFSHNWDDYAIQADKAHFQVGNLTADIVERKWHEAHRRFYLRPSRVARRLMMPDTWRNLPRRVQDVSRMMLGSRSGAGASAH
ncbi:MAG: B12-binding domain-containing radical SAM protein [Chloroflexi bacterium]|nr:B12-binding domain-containing radical SAM protein [Chloroflexota bacterium]